MPRPIFDEASHTYTTPDGRPLSGVTAILGEYVRVERLNCAIHVTSGNSIPLPILDAAADFGTAVHTALEYALEYGSGGFDYPDKLAPVVDQIQKFIDFYQPEPILTEIPLYSEHYHFAGTPDLFCKIKGKYCLIDAKTGANDLVGPQTAAYEQLVREETGIKKVIDRYLLALPKNGADYRFVPLTNPLDWTYFKNKRFIYNFNKELTHGK